MVTFDLSKIKLNRVHAGGYEDFSAVYPFLRTKKIIYMPRVSTVCNKSIGYMT